MPELVKKIEEAAENLENQVKKTPLDFCPRLSKKYQAKIYLKREDLQEVRSFKIRGAFNKMSVLSDDEKKCGVVTASAGNHAQGVALSCARLKIKGVIFMPQVTPNQKIERVKYFGDGFIETKLVGDNFDAANAAAKNYAKEKGALYVPPFDDQLVIAGQGTLGKEIYDELFGRLDYVLVGVGGGGLASGVACYIKNKNPKIKVLGVEPDGASAMYKSFKEDKLVTLEKVDTFVDGVAVKTVGQLTFKICKKYLDKVVTVPEGKVAQTMIDLYQNEGIIAEPAGALSVAVLDDLAEEIRDKSVVAVISGGNNDLLRYSEILEKSLVYQGRKHYFLVEFAQKPGQFKKFVNNVLGPGDDIVLFEYVKKNNREEGPAMVGIELKDKKDLAGIVKRLKEFGFNYKLIVDGELLYNYLV